MSDKPLLNVRIRDTEHVLFEGQADRVNSYNEMGPFDIYPMHANFISIIKKKLTVYLRHERLKELTFEQAILKVKKDVVHIYLGIEIFAIEETDTVAQLPQSPKLQK